MSRDPERGRARRPEFPVHPVARSGRHLVADRGSPDLAADGALEIRGPHQAGDRATSSLDTFAAELPPDLAPANLIETVNTMGLPIHARQLARPDGSAIEVKTEASILPVNKRPRPAVRIHSSN